MKASLIYEEKWVKAYIILWINIPQNIFLNESCIFWNIFCF
ncbi:hypothetical protein BACFIN_05219 [Bacteroides finegoldii DSM 17565]|nr:hypothetical protein BACFIN_05219 [Bacteroides finegoldii DSM 17565]